MIWPFDDPPNALAITVRAIVSDGHPILLVARDSEEGDWQFLSGEPFDVSQGLLVTLQSIAALDPTINELANLAPGWEASRPSVGQPWQCSQSSDESTYEP